MRATDDPKSARRSTRNLQPMPAVIIVTSPRRRPRRVASRAQAAAHLRERHDADHRAHARRRPPDDGDAIARRPPRLARRARLRLVRSRFRSRLGTANVVFAPSPLDLGPSRVARRGPARAPSPRRRDEPDRDEDGLYIGTYSNFFTDPDQIKGVIIFCAFLASFLSLGNVGAAILLPILYDQPIQTCIQGILFGYYCPP